MQPSQVVQVGKCAIVYGHDVAALNGDGMEPGSSQKHVRLESRQIIAI